MSVTRKKSVVNGFEIASIKAGVSPHYVPIFTLTDAVGHSWETSITDCSCRGVTPHDRPSDMPDCLHMLSVKQWIEIMFEISEAFTPDDHESYITMKGPL